MIPPFPGLSQKKAAPPPKNGSAGVTTLKDSQGTECPRCSNGTRGIVAREVYRERSGTVPKGRSSAQSQWIRLPLSTCHRHPDLRKADACEWPLQRARALPWLVALRLQQLRREAQRHIGRSRRGAALLAP